MFIRQFANEFLKDILRSDETRNPTVLINYQCEVRVVRLHDTQFIVRKFHLRHECRRARNVSYLDVQSIVPLEGASRQILHVEDTLHLIKRLSDDWHAGESGGNEQFEGRVTVLVPLDSHHLSAGHHELPDPGLPQLKNRTQNLAVRFLQWGRLTILRDLIEKLTQLIHHRQSCFWHHLNVVAPRENAQRRL